MNNLETTIGTRSEQTANETSDPPGPENTPEENRTTEKRDKVELMAAIAEFKQAAKIFISKKDQLAKISGRLDLLLETQKIRIVDPEKFRANMAWIHDAMENIKAAEEHLSVSSRELFNELSVEEKGIDFVKMITDGMRADCAAIDRFQVDIDRIDY